MGPADVAFLHKVQELIQVAASEPEGSTLRELAQDARALAAEAYVQPEAVDTEWQS